MSRHAATLTALGIRRDEDEAHQRPLNLSLIKRLFRYTRPYAAKRNWLLAMVVTRSIQLPCIALVIAKIINGPIEDGNIPMAVWGAIGLFVLAFVTQVTFHFRTRLALELGESVIQDLRRDIFNHIQFMPMSYFDKTKIGRSISRITSDAEVVRQGIQDVLFVTLVQLGQGLFAASVMLYYDWSLFLVLAASAPVLYLIIMYFRKRLSTAYRNQQESFSRITANLAESVSGIRVTQGFVRQDINADLFHELATDHSNYNIESARASGMFMPLLELNSQVFIAIVLLIGGWQVLHHQPSTLASTTAPAAIVQPDSPTADSVIKEEEEDDAKNLIYFLLMIPMFFGPVSAIGRQYNTALTAMAGAERVFGLLDAKPQWSDHPDAVTLPDFTGRVEFRNVTFGYDPAKPVLHDINFVAEPGQTIALVGETGSGKTSIINLIAKFYLPTSGQVLIDGYDITKLSSDSLHHRMGIVLQQNFLFSGTVMDNIRFGRPQAPNLEVIDAAQKLDCLDLIDSMPDGFKTEVGEGGKGISLGQRQLICFTRAMLADPRILILDEATSSVDTMTEARIQTALAKLLEQRTNFVVAHRLSTIRHADIVLVLDKGRIVERGSHTQLLANGGHYARLYRQFIRAGED